MECSSLDGSFAQTGAPALDARIAELLPLPAAPLLHEFLTRSQHQHLGYFEGPADALAQALERAVTRGFRLLGRDSLVADVGCGLGGGVNLLAAQGHRVYGIDPCERSIAYARARSSSPRVQFLACGLAEFATRARGARFDALVLTEVLPCFPDLGAVVAQCRALLRPGGILLVHDIVREPGAGSVPGSYHPRGALRAAADGAGFDVVEARDVSNRTAPTLPRLLRGLAERRSEILRLFASARPTIAAELEELLAHLRDLERAFARQELACEASVLRCSPRLGTDSVVLRPVPRRNGPG